MTKKSMIEFINKNYEWFECMQKGLGHHSWWYTNRSPKECINVKINSWIDTDKLTARLSEQEKNVIESLGININEWANDVIWGDSGMVEQTRELMLEALKEKYHVIDCEYGGRSGGWLAVVFEWESIPEDYDNPDYTYNDITKFYRTIIQALKEYDKVKNYVLVRKHNLEIEIKTIDNYIDQLQEYISNSLYDKQMESKRILAI